MSIVRPEIGEALRREVAQLPEWSIHDWYTSIRTSAESMASEIRCRHPVDLPVVGSITGHRPGNGGFVYVVRALMPNGLVKIGRSATPAEALPKVQGRSPVQLELVALGRGHADLERHWHRVFRDVRRHGEWFDGSVGLVFADAMARAPAGGCARCVLVGDQQTIL